MPGLQKRTRRQAETSSPRGDVENPKGESGPTEAAQASAVPSTSGHSPILLARMIFRKALAQLASNEDDDDDESPGIISVLRKIIVGVILGVVVVSALIVLYHRDFIHLESAHYLHDAAYQLLTDPETVASIEESTDLKFLPKARYESYQSELQSLAQQKVGIEEKATKTKEMEAENEKLVIYIRSQHKMKSSESWRVRGVHSARANGGGASDPSIMLHMWCDECTFEGAVKCMGRVIFISAQDKIGKDEAKLKIMESAPQCKKKSGG